MNLRLLLWRLFGFVIGKYSMFTAPSSHHDDVCIDFSWESKGNPPKATSPKDPFHPRHGTQLFFSPNSNTNSCHKCLDVPYCYLSLPSFLIISINQTALKPAVQLPERSFRESSGNFRNSVINESLLWPTPTKKKREGSTPRPESLIRDALPKRHFMAKSPKMTLCSLQSGLMDSSNHRQKENFWSIFNTPQ